MAESTTNSADPLADVGELDFLEAAESDRVATGDGMAVFDVTVTADFASQAQPTTQRQDIEVPPIEVFEGGGAEVTEDGSIVVDKVSVTFDEESGSVVIDEVVGVVLPDGTEIYDETVSVLDADGNFTVVGESVEVV